MPLVSPAISCPWKPEVHIHTDYYPHLYRNETWLEACQGCRGKICSRREERFTRKFLLKERRPHGESQPLQCYVTFHFVPLKTCPKFEQDYPESWYEQQGFEKLSNVDFTDHWTTCSAEDFKATYMLYKNMDGHHCLEKRVDERQSGQFIIFRTLRFGILFSNPS